MAVGRNRRQTHRRGERRDRGDERGFIPVDRQMRTNVPHIFAIGDIVGQPMLAHKAVHEGKVAAETAAGRNAFFDAKVIPSVAYTDPEVAWVGLTENEAKAKESVRQGVFPWAARPLPRSARRGSHQGPVRRDHGPDHRLQHRRAVRGRPDRRGRACHRDGRGCAGYRADHSPAPDPLGDDWHGGGSLRGHDHRPLHTEEAAKEGALS